MARGGAIDIVMTGHLSHAKLTGGEPATLSRTAIEGLLRRDIGYQGAVMTDDLDMAAIRSSYSLTDAVVRAIAAGNDIILLSNSLKPDANLPVAVIASVKEATASGRIPRAASNNRWRGSRALRRAFSQPQPSNPPMCFCA